MKIWFLLLLVAIVISEPRKISLDGVWSANSPSNESIRVPAHVPGYIHTDLLRAGIIQDPYYRFNDVEYRWISAVNWTFQRTFNLDVIAEKVDLVCEGVDTVAMISINGKTIGTTNNQFKRYIFPVKEHLLVGENSIVFTFQSAMDYSGKARAKYPYHVPHDYHAFSNGEQNRNFIRKQQCSFSWDWGPCFLPQGIWRSVYLTAYDNPFLRDVIPRVSDKEMNVRIVVVSNKVVQTKVHFEVARVLSADREVALKIGVNEFEFEFKDLNNAKLWWPAGYGEQVLYNLVVSLPDFQNVVTKRIAFRKVILNQKRLAKDEKEFHFTINDVIIFNRGANFIPMDSFERQDDKVIDNLIQSALDANMNTLRIWGGGNYQSDRFYDRCDEAGIVVWQEFMFACALYPRDKEFLENVREEVQYNVQRLVHHPSILVWSGNNENEIAIYGSTWYPNVINTDNKPIYYIDYAKLFLEVIHDAVHKEDPYRTYVHSSPSNGPVSVEPFVGEWLNPMSEKMGDIHIFEYWNDCTDVKHYLTPRGATEYGWQAFPSYRSLEKISKPEDLVFGSSLMKHRQHHAQGTEQLVAQIKRHFRDHTDLQDFIYLSQCVQSLCIRSQTEHYRRGSGTDRRTRMSLYWQFNDIWQAPSWSSLEYSGKWKMLHYHSQRFFAQFLISGFTNDGKVFVHISNDSPKEIKDIAIILEVFSWTGELKHLIRVNDAIVGPSTSKEVYQSSIDDLMRLASCQKESCVLMIQASSSPLKTHNVVYFSPLKTNLVPNRFRITDVKLESELIAIVSVSSAQMAPYTFLDVENEGRWETNSVLMKKDETRVFRFIGWKSIDLDLFKRTLSVKSLNSISNDE